MSKQPETPRFKFVCKPWMEKVGDRSTWQYDINLYFVDAEGKEHEVPASAFRFSFDVTNILPSCSIDLLQPEVYIELEHQDVVRKIVELDEGHNYSVNVSDEQRDPVA
jgi:hypothetical protein